MSDIISAQSVLLDQHAASREEAIGIIATKAAELGIADDADALRQAFMAREAMGETGMTDGFAIPHAKSAEPLDWPSFDEKPVTCAIALMVPDGEAGSEHIRLLSKTATLLMNDGFKGIVHQSSDPAEIAAAIQKGIEG